MTFRRLVVFPIVVFSLGAVLTAQVARNDDVVLNNWPAALYWQPARSETEALGLRPEIREAAPKATTPAGSLVFVAMTPCRVVDTRATQMFPGAFGAPSLVANATRSFPIQSSANCTIPSTAQAYSFNVTLVPPAGVGYLKIWPTGVTEPNAVTIDDVRRHPEQRGHCTGWNSQRIRGCESERNHGFGD